MKTKYQIDCKLDDSNYHYWRFKMIPLLEDEELLDPGVETDDLNPAIDSIILKDTPGSKRAIITNVCDEIGTTLMLHGTAQAMWEYLFTEFSGKNETRKLTGIKKLAQFRYSASSMKENLKIMNLLLTQTIVAAGSASFNFSDLGVAMFLNSLPEEYHATRTILEQSTEPMTMKSITTALLAEDARLKTRENSNGFSGMTSTKCQHGRLKPRCWTCNPHLHPDNLKCVDCSQSKHKSKLSRRCLKYQAQNTNGTAGILADFDAGWTPKLPFAGMAHTTPRVSKKRRMTPSVKSHATPRVAPSNLCDEDLRFVIDSGCSQSLVNNKASLTHYTNAHFTMQTASTDVLHCPGKGDVTVNNDITITNAVYSPDATMNLLSVAQICDLGNQVRFDSQHATIYNRSNRVILRGNRVGGLYLFKKPRTATALPSPAGQSFLTKSSTNTVLFHRRMGHLNYQSLRLLSHIAQGIILDANPTDLCIPCTQAKTHRKTFHSSDNRATRIGELVHTDICYIGIPTIVGEFKSFLLFVDDCTRYTTIYLLRNKSDAVAAFKDYDTKLHNSTGRHVTVLRSDGGSEFFNATMTEHCGKHGISQQSSTPYTPQHNGRAERLNRTIVEGISAMLFDSHLPWEFWGYAAKTFVYLKNRSPHSALPQSTPFAEQYRQIPDLSTIRVFGTKCHAFIPREKRIGAGSKLLPRTREMILVGYSDRHKAYTLYDQESNIEIVSAEVVFENELTSRGTNQLYPETFSQHLFPVDKSQSNPSAEATDHQQNPVEQEPVAESTPTDHYPVDPTNVAESTKTPETIIPAEQDHFIENEAVETADNDTTSDHESDSLDDLVSYYANTPLINEAPNYHQAMSGPNATEFQIAIAKEYASLESNRVFSKPMRLPDGKIALGTKMVLKIKESASDEIPRKFKARLCGKGYRQIFGVDYHHTYAPVAAYNSIRMMISLCASIDYEVDNIDFITAFLHAELDEEIYISIPDGYPIKTKEPNMVLKLQKSLYGLKQAPYAWNRELDTYLKSLNFTPTESERCLYLGRWENVTIYLLVYVDDIIIGAPCRDTMAQVKSKINQRFPSEDHGPIQFFLNMHFERDWKNHTISIHQEPKIAKVISDPRLTEEDRLFITKPCKIPASNDVRLSKTMSPKT